MHAAARGSGRVGRSAAGRALDAGAIELAVTASVRHRDTAYDELLMSGLDRETARERVRDDVFRTLERWRTAHDQRPKGLSADAPQPHLVEARWRDDALGGDPAARLVETR